jgi:hypothetical protein
LRQKQLLIGPHLWQSGCFGDDIQEKFEPMSVTGNCGQLRDQLALCRRLALRVVDDEVRKAIDDYASELETRLWLLLLTDETLPAGPW